MPRIKHWFPVSHDFLHDPELIELLETHGQWMLRVWLEMLSIADRNEGEIRGDVEWIASSLTWLYGSNSRRYNTEWRRNELRKTFEWMSNKGWIRVERNAIFICNYWKYHRRGEHNPIPSEPILSEPDLRVSSYKNTQRPDSASPVSKKVKKENARKEYPEMAKGMGLIPELKEQTDALYFSDPVKFKRIAAWVAQGRKYEYSEPVMAEAIRQFRAGHYDLVDDWYPYLDTILEKVDKDRNRDEHDEEHRKHKEEVREASKMFLVKG